MVWLKLVLVRKCLAVAMLFAPLVHPANAETFPTGDVFRPLVADPAEPRFFISVLRTDTGADRLGLASVGGGSNFGLRRWPGERPGEGWQAGIFAFVFSQFNLDAPSAALINTDYRVGLPLTYKHGAFSARARVWQFYRDDIAYYGLAVQFDL